MQLPSELRSLPCLRVCAPREDPEHANAIVHVMRRIERVRYSSTLDPHELLDCYHQVVSVQIARSSILRDRVWQLLLLQLAWPNVARDLRT